MAETKAGRRRREDGVQPSPVLAQALARRGTHRRTTEPEEAKG